MGDEAKGGDTIVLVVDDNEELRGFIKHALTLADYTVLEAPDGEGALTALQTVRQLDLVLCDVILPGIKGLALLEKIRGIFPEVKVISMSGYVSDGVVSQEVEQTMAAGGVFLQKPFATRQLLETVHHVLEAK